MFAGRWSSQHTLARVGLALTIAVGVSSLPRLALADNSPQAPPFVQAWTNVGLITADDTWSGVPGVVGYRGDDLTSTTGVDPQTVLADGTGVVDVIANQTNTAITTGGVAEFELANPLVALQGSGTADAPFVLIHLNTSGQQDISVSYILRDIDGTTDNATQPVALQYRVGTSGTFTNVPAAFVADATSGPSTATLETPVSVVLPAAANNQAQLQLRIITTNAVGNDEWVGVDDIQVSAGSVPDAAPTVTTTTPANGALNVNAGGDLRISFSEPVTAGSGAFVLACDGATQSFAITPTTGAATSFTLNPNADLPAGATCTLTANAAQISDVDGAPTPLAADYNVNFTVAAGPQPGACSAADTPIGAVQGSGNNAAITGQVTVQGVVVGDYEGVSPALRGFYLQDTGDSNAETSDGIFVFNNNNNSVSAGQTVQVTGTAGEFNSQTQISLSSATPQIEICGNGEISPTEVTLPIPAPINGVSYFERFEGMLVVFPQELGVTDNFTLARFGELGLSSGGRLFQPTNFVDPTDDPASETENDEDNKAAVVAQQNLNDRNKITLDDASTAQNSAIIPYLNEQNTRRLGDTVTGLRGVLNFAFSLYRVQPVGPVAFVDANPRTAAPPVGGNLKVASFNVLNYFNNFNDPNSTADNVCGPLANQECRGANGQAEFDRQRAKIFAALRGLDADIVGLIEMENDGDGASSAIANLVSGLNASIVAAGGAANTYAYIADPVGYGPESAAALYPGGDDAIKVAFIYKPARVSPLGAAIASPDAAFENARAPLAQTFRLNSNGAIFTPIINHFKSKSGTGTGADADQGDGQGNFNASRVAQAQAVTQFAAQVAARAGDPDVLLLGDLNAYTQEDPVDVLQTSGFINLIDSGTAYSYNFSAQSGSLDHALANSSMRAQIKAAEKWHINSDEPIFLDYNAEFKTPNVATPDLYAPDAFKSSDHDPVLVGIDLATPNTPPTLTAIATYNTGLGENGAEIIDIRGDRAVLTNAGAGSLDILDTSDLLAITRTLRIEGLTGLNSAAIHPTKDFFLAVTGTSGNIGTVRAYRLSDGTLLAQAATGIQPDSVDISPDGNYAVIANEAESVAQGNNGGPGSLSLVDLRGFDPASSTSLSVAQVALPSITNVPGISSGRSDDIGRLPIDNTPDTIEPETVTFSADGATAYISLQENNAVARLTLADNSLSFFGLGKSNHPADLINGDGYKPSGALTAFREPDGLAAIEIAGTRYIVTADEGDSRDDLIAGAGSGRVRGGRTVSVFNAETGAFVADTGNQLDDIAALYGRYADTRSDRGGSEPEVLDATVFGGRAIVAVGLERANAVALVDITTPADPYVFSLIPTGNNPEGIKLVVRNGGLFALAANEVSGTVTVARVPIGSFAIEQAYVEDTPLAVPDLYVIDPDADTISVAITLDPAAGMLSGIASTGSGSYATSGTAAQVNAVLADITFSPAPNQNGTFTAGIVVSDGSTTSNGTLKLVGTAANDVPTAVDDSYIVDAGSTLSVPAPGVLANDADPDGDTLRALLATATTNGTLSLDANGGFSYTPNPGFSGTDSFTYKANDGAADSNVATVTITVADTNTAPTATLAANLCLNGTLPAGSLSLAVEDKETSANKLTVTRSSSNQSLVPNNAVSIIGSGKNRIVTIVAVPNRSGSAVITLNVGDGQKTTTITFNVIVGSKNNDTLAGDTGPDMIFGLGGNDVIDGGAGANLVCAGSGNDTVTSADGNDVILAGDGDDSVRSGGGDDLIVGDDGRDTIEAGAGRDTLLGGDDNDTLTGGAGADLFDGGRGRDTATDVNRAEGDRTANIP